MKLVRIAATLCVCAASISCATAPTPDQAPAGANQVTGDRPALMMLVVVDQLRSSLLDRYDNLFTGGFRRLRDEGYSFTNASQAHAATETAVGHATLSTGSYPNHHGIIGNAWYEKVGGNWVVVQNVGDSTVKIVGAPASPGISPVNLMRPGLAEWVSGADSKSIIASVSGKDRGAVQPAAHSKNGYVYWFDPALGKYVTSTYYRDRDPDWITSFNTTTLQTHLADSVGVLEFRRAHWVARTRTRSQQKETERTPISRTGSR